MQSASLSGRLRLVPDVLLENARTSMAGGQAWAAAIVIVLTFTVARSTSTAGWVTGIDVITLIALGGAVFLGALALMRVPWPIALGLGTLAAPVVALFGTFSAPGGRHVTTLLQIEGVLSNWWTRINDGSIASVPSFFLFLICLLMWVTGGWLSWCVLRWRKPMLGLIPGAAAFATNLLNFPDNQTGYTLAMLVLTLALLLWTNYNGSIANAEQAHVKLTGDARWDFWESGLVAMAALIVLAILLPPLSTADRTLDVESSMFSNWAQLQQRINHPGFFTVGQGGPGTTGFSTDVKLSGPLQRTRDVAFTYTTSGDYTGPRYFRGVDETVTLYGEWRYPSPNGLRQPLQKNESPSYFEEYQRLAVSSVDVKMVRPPIGNVDILFYPGELYKVDRPSLASQVPLPFSVQGSLLKTIDRLSSVQPSTSLGRYKATVQYSIATVEELQSAGTYYPDWLQQYMSYPGDGRYRSPAVMKRIHDLAVQVVNSANATTPYDEASAIEAYLRSDKFTYTLDPPRPPPGVDLLDNFLFTSHKGYCEYFATAMGDMLRSLGIPTRLVNGFGPGSYDTQSASYVVRGEDAHTWVEVYFPTYGWIPFEPTRDSDNLYQTIPRGSSGQVACLVPTACDGSAGSQGGSPNQATGRGNKNDPEGPGTGGFKVTVPDASTFTKVVGLVVAVLLLLLAAASRYLRPRKVTAVWRRMLTLASLAGAERRPGETPLEVGRRLKSTFPEASEPIGTLTSGFVVAAYAPPEVASTARSTIMESWSALRPLLIRRVLTRLRRRG